MNENPQYKPGDVVNGYRLSADGTRWEPVISTFASQPEGKKNWFARHKVFTAIGGSAAALVLLIGVGSAASGPAQQTPVASTQSNSSSRATPAPQSTPQVQPEAQEALPEPEPVYTAKPVKHKSVSEREFAKIMKNPDGAIGDRVIVYAEVTQFDSATGTDAFRGDVANTINQSYGWFDGENAMFSGSTRQLNDVVADDIVRVKVTVLGSLSYETQMGGETTAPMFQVDSISVVG